MKTTLNKIREREPCKSGWEKLLAYLGKTKADDESVSIATILDSNGLNDAIWCLRAVEGYDKEIRLFAVWCARQVQHLMTDQRSIDALNVAERYANGEATEEERKAAARAANAAALSARDAAARAAWADDAAAWDAWDAADRAAWDASAAARSTFYSAKSAAYAIDEYSFAVEYATASAAWGVSGAADWDRMRAKQEAELRRICEEG